MIKLKVMRGSKERANDVRQWLKEQGAMNVEDWDCDSEGWFYYVFKGEGRTAYSEDEMWEIVPHEIVELPQPEHQFKPFERVLVRDYDYEKWTCNLFSHYNDKDRITPFVCINYPWTQCIPYEGNEHLLDTTYSPKGE